jgi:hypothetical protein
MRERVDHLVYAVPDLDAAVDELERRLGVRASPGGSHPGRGTRNALLALGPRSYLEIVAPDPGQPAPTAARWFGIDSLAAPRLATWAAHATDLATVVFEAARHGIVLGPVGSGSRRRPDGVTLSWVFTDPATVVDDGVVPFFIDWGASPHPAAVATGGAELVAFEAEHPDPDGVRARLLALGLDVPVVLGPRPALIATLRSPAGIVQLR